ncbi:putative transposase (plasmid) [Agrobacterium tumefaciens]|nr:putative transposase [Agrobacterium tumefaciens]
MLIRTALRRLRKATAQKEAVTKGCLASGRGGCDDRRSKALALASRRPGPICSRRDRASPSRHHGCEAIVDQTAEEARPRAEKIITDKLRSYGAAKRDVMPAIEHRSHKGLDNRAENSHLPLRK